MPVLVMRPRACLVPLECSDGTRPTKAIVRGAEADLPTFRAIRKKLPYPANSTTTLEECVDGILTGFAKRKARVYIPKGVVLANFTKPLVNSVLAWPVLRRISGKQVPSLEADVDQLGRFQHAHVPLTDPENDAR